MASVVSADKIVRNVLFLEWTKLMRQVLSRQTRLVARVCVFDCFLFRCNCFCSFVAILEKREEVKICYDFENSSLLKFCCNLDKREEHLSLSLSLFFL